MNNSTPLDDEVGDAASLARRLRQKQQISSNANFNANAKRAQSVESMLDRIPNVGLSPHSDVGMYDFLHNAAKMSKFSQNAVEMQSKCSLNTVKMQSVIVD